MNATEHKSGYVALIGRPNVGKSTLMNRVLGQKLAAVTPRAQTTRNRIFGIYDEEHCQLIFQDTPGILQPRDAMHEFMLREADRALEDADVALWLIDGEKRLLPGDSEMVMNALKKHDLPLLVCVNKMDIVPLEERTSLLEGIRTIDSVPDENVYYISALHGDGVEPILEHLVRLLPEGPKFYPQDQLSDRTQRFFIEEIIREKAFLRLRDEIPYALAVQVETMTERAQGTTYIQAAIHVERDSQKSIILGKRGSMIKQIGQDARKDIEELLGQRVYLELWVRVSEKWRKKDRWLREFGYSDPM